MKYYFPTVNHLVWYHVKQKRFGLPKNIPLIYHFKGQVKRPNKAKCLGRLARRSQNAIPELLHTHTHSDNMVTDKFS